MPSGGTPDGGTVPQPPKAGRSAAVVPSASMTETAPYNYYQQGSTIPAVNPQTAAGPTVQTTAAGTNYGMAKPGEQGKKATAAPAPEVQPTVALYPNQDPGGTGGDGTGGGPPNPYPGGGKGGAPGGTTGGSNGESGTWGLGEGEGGYTSPEGGLFDYYRQKMASTGMSPAAQAALATTTLNPIQQQQAASLDQMKRFRAATGNDAGIYAGISELGRQAGDQTAEQKRKNFLTNEELARQDQKEGAAGGLNLYGQTQAEAMEYLRMLGNILGREDFINTSGSGSGSSVGINWNPGGSSI